MNKAIHVWLVTLLLTSTAGFRDTITFVAADQLFSAHVTGNFIVFAYDIVTGSDARAWIKLITLPVFIISVITAGWIIRKGRHRYFLLLAESVLLISGGLVALVFRLNGATSLSWPVYFVKCSALSQGRGKCFFLDHLSKVYSLLEEDRIS